MKDRVLVTGGAGFIGSHLCEKLLMNGFRVRVLDALVPQVHGVNPGWPRYLPADIERIRGDVRNREVLRSALTGCSYVIHLASVVGVGQSMYEIEHYTSVNVLGTSILLELLTNNTKKIKKLIVASSMSVYGEGEYVRKDKSNVLVTQRKTADLKKQKWEFTDEDGNELIPRKTRESKPLQPTSVYAITKRDQEEMCLCVGKAYGIPVVALRMFNVYGSRQALSNPYTGVVAIFCSRLLRGKQPIVFEDGQQRRDFVRVEDVVEVYTRALTDPSLDGLAVNLGSGESITVNEIANRVGVALGIQRKPRVIEKFREGDIRHCFADVRLLKERLGFQPNSDFDRGLGPLIDYLKTTEVEASAEEVITELEEKGLLK